MNNKLNLTSQITLNKEERLSKLRAKELYDSGQLEGQIQGTFKELVFIHQYLFQDIYFFSGEKRSVNISKGNFRFAPVMYLDVSLNHIDQMPMTIFDEIVEKYVEMNIAHPFREGNGRSMRIWLDTIFKSQLKVVVDWNLVDKADYLLAVERSPVKDIELKYLLKKALIKDINSREIYMKGIDISYYYEGYTEFITDDLTK